MLLGVLAFEYEAVSGGSKLTSVGGLPLYLDLIKASGLGAAIRQHLDLSGGQGWLHLQMVLTVLALPSVPMKLRHFPPGSLHAKARKDSPDHVDVSLP